MQEDEHDEDRRGRHRTARRIAAPGDCQGAGDEQHEQRERQRVVPGRDHEQHRGEQIGGDCAGGNEVDLAFTRIGPENETRDDEERSEAEACGDVEGVRGERVEIADAR